MFSWIYVGVPAVLYFFPFALVDGMAEEEEPPKNKNVALASVHRLMLILC